MHQLLHRQASGFSNVIYSSINDTLIKKLFYLRFQAHKCSSYCKLFLPESVALGHPTNMLLPASFRIFYLVFHSVCYPGVVLATLDSSYEDQYDLNTVATSQWGHTPGSLVLLLVLQNPLQYSPWPLLPRCHHAAMPTIFYHCYQLAGEEYAAELPMAMGGINCDYKLHNLLATSLQLKFCCQNVRYILLSQYHDHFKGRLSTDLQSNLMAVAIYLAVHYGPTNHINITGSMKTDKLLVSICQNHHYTVILRRC